MQSLAHRGMTLVEIMVVSLIISILAAMSFPLFGIIQQRERERRLKLILNNIHSSIYGSSQYREGRIYTEGYRIYAIGKIYEEVDAQGDPIASAEFAIASGSKMGLLFPIDPMKVENSNGVSFKLPTDESGSDVEIAINRRFIRNIPPHPFKGVVPEAHWEFRAATTTYPIEWFASESWPYGFATGVIEIRSTGAGIALNGENTDDWR